MNLLGGWFTNHHMCRLVEVKEEEDTMEEKVIITIELEESLLMRYIMY